MACNLIISWNFKVPSNPVLWLHWTSPGQLLGSQWLHTLSPHPQGSKGRKAGHGGCGQPRTAPLDCSFLHSVAPQGLYGPQPSQCSSTPHSCHSFEAHPLMCLRVCRGQGSPRPGPPPPLPCCYMAVPHTFSFYLTHCRASILLHLILAHFCWAQPSPVFGPPPFIRWPRCPPPLLYLFY